MPIPGRACSELAEQRPERHLEPFPVRMVLEVRQDHSQQSGPRKTGVPAVKRYHCAEDVLRGDMHVGVRFQYGAQQGHAAPARAHDEERPVALVAMERTPHQQHRQVPNDAPDQRATSFCHLSSALKAKRSRGGSVRPRV